MMSVLSLGARGFDPLGIGRRSLAMRSVLLVLGTAVLALASQVSVPMVPVPITCRPSR